MWHHVASDYRLWRYGELAEITICVYIVVYGSVITIRVRDRVSV